MASTWCDHESHGTRPPPAWPSTPATRAGSSMSVSLSRQCSNRKQFVSSTGGVFIYIYFHATLDLEPVSLPWRPWGRDHEVGWWQLWRCCPLLLTRPPPEPRPLHTAVSWDSSWQPGPIITITVHTSLHLIDPLDILCIISYLCLNLHLLIVN